MPHVVATGLSLREADAFFARWRDGGGGAEPEEEGWCFYLLQSVDGRRTYEGATNNPSRRLAKHNGFAHGGACKTRTGRPWSMVLFVHGFRSKRDALCFEKAMQRPRVGSTPAPAVAAPAVLVCTRAGKCAACVWSPLTGCALPMAISVAALPRAASAIHRQRSRTGVASECLRLPAHSWVASPAGEPLLRQRPRPRIGQHEARPPEGARRARYARVARISLAARPPFASRSDGLVSDCSRTIRVARRRREPRASVTRRANPASATAAAVPAGRPAATFGLAVCPTACLTATVAIVVIVVCRTRAPAPTDQHRSPPAFTCGGPLCCVCRVCSVPSQPHYSPRRSSTATTIQPWGSICCAASGRRVARRASARRQTRSRPMRTTRSQGACARRWCTVQRGARRCASRVGAHWRQGCSGRKAVVVVGPRAAQAGQHHEVLGPGRSRHRRPLFPSTTDTRESSCTTALH